MTCAVLSHPKYKNLLNKNSYIIMLIEQFLKIVSLK